LNAEIDLVTNQRQNDEMLLEKLSRKIRVIATCATFIWIMTHFVFHGVSTFSLYLEFASLLVIFGMIPIYSIHYLPIIRMRYFHHKDDDRRNCVAAFDHSL
jgi:hypothetical protein